jgi:nucleoid-associated protein EbfC
MFDNLKNLAGLMGNAKELRAKFEDMQRELARKTVEADAGAGAVRVVVNGKLEVVRITLDPPMLRTLVGEGDEADTQMIEDLIAAAVNAGLARARQLMQDEMGKLTGGLNIPGLDRLMGSGGGGGA